MRSSAQGCETVMEPARTLPVSGAYDVVVVGAGLAGVGAALAAARQGASTALAERCFGLGGLATLGNVTVYLPICDGYGHQVMGGLAEELLLLSARDLRKTQGHLYFSGPPDHWLQPTPAEERKGKRRYESRFNPYAYQMELEVMVREAGIDLWYDTRLCAVLRQGDHVSHLVVENKDGRSAFACRTVVDASGDADVCALAGEETESLDNNVLTGWYYELADDSCRIRPWTNRPNLLGGKDGAEGPLFAGDRARDVTEHVLETRAEIGRRIGKRRAEDPEADIQPFGLPSIPCFRMTRRLISSFSLMEAHDHVWFDDAIGLTGHWWKKGPVYAIPYRCIRAERNRNLLVAGRCISTDASAWDVTRAIPACVLTGEAAGTAAAMACAGSGGDTHDVPVAALQARLREARNIIDPELMREKQEVLLP